MELFLNAKEDVEEVVFLASFCILRGKKMCMYGWKGCLTVLGWQSWRV